MHMQSSYEQPTMLLIISMLLTLFCGVVISQTRSPFQPNSGTASNGKPRRINTLLQEANELSAIAVATRKNCFPQAEFSMPSAPEFFLKFWSLGDSNP